MGEDTKQIPDEFQRAFQGSTSFCIGYNFKVKFLNRCQSISISFVYGQGKGSIGSKKYIILLYEAMLAT
jgi:hypothetical protein